MSTSVVRVPILPMHMVNAFVVFGPDGCIVVDAGVPGSEPRFERVLRTRGRGWSDVRLIVVTHAHVDHAGAAAALRARAGAPIAAHVGDVDHFRGDRPMHFCATGPFGRTFLRTGVPRRRYAPFEPDILLHSRDSFSLAPFGVDGRVVETVGHTAGSISVLLQGGEALVGDLLASGLLLGGIARRGRPKRPPFEDDPLAVARCLRHLLELRMHTFYLGHGGPLPAEAVRRHVSALEVVGRR